MKYSAEDLEAVAAQLRQLPRIENAKTLSKADAIQALATEIQQLKERGYTMEQIAEALSGAGLQIATTTRRNYLQRSEPKSRRPKRRSASMQKPRSNPAEPATPQPTPGSFEAPADTDDI